MVYMKQLSLFIMTYKGYKTLEAIVNNKLESLVKFVVIGEDKNTLNDYSGEIEELCKLNNIKYYFRKDNFQVYQNI